MDREYRLLKIVEKGKNLVSYSLIGSDLRLSGKIFGNGDVTDYTYDNGRSISQLIVKTKNL
jgi:hypothetical protein